MDTIEAFLLLSIPRATLKTPTVTYTDVLYLECVTVSPSVSPFPDHDVYLVLRVSDYEIAIDPSRKISQSVPQTGHIVYIFHATDSDAQVEVAIPEPHQDYVVEDLETFDHILNQYAQFQMDETALGREVDSKEAHPPTPGGDNDDYEDLRGRLVLINEFDGGIMGELDHQLKIHEDPTLTDGLSENDTVILDLPPDYDSVIASNSLGSSAIEGPNREVIAHAIPPMERDALTETTSLVSHALSATTTLLLSGLSYATDFYVNHSTPSRDLPTPSSSSSRSANLPSSHSASPSSHRAVVTNSNTRKILTHAHSVSGKVVKVSGKTAGLVDHLIGKAVGSKGKDKAKRPRLLAFLPQHPSEPVQPSYLPYGNSNVQITGRENSRSFFPSRPTLRKRDKIMLSADLILSTIEESARRVIDGGSRELTKVVAHKHGQEAAENSILAAGTARNVALVYIDMRGVGRRAILRRTGKQFIKARIGSHSSSRLHDASTGGDQLRQQSTQQTTYA